MRVDLPPPSIVESSNLVPIIVIGVVAVVVVVALVWFLRSRRK